MNARLKARVPDERSAGFARAKRDPGPRGTNAACGPGSRIVASRGFAAGTLVRDTLFQLNPTILRMSADVAPSARSARNEVERVNFESLWPCELRIRRW